MRLLSLLDWTIDGFRLRVKYTGGLERAPHAPLGARGAPGYPGRASMLRGDWAWGRCVAIGRGVDRWLRLGWPAAILPLVDGQPVGA